jgi:hypothetical protein
MNRNRVGIIKVYKNHSPSNLAVTLLIRIHPETRFLHVILRSPAKSGTTKNLGILRGVYPELAEGLRMTLGSFLMYPD